MLGVELVSDREKKTPAKAEILHVMDQMKGECVSWFPAYYFARRFLVCFEYGTSFPID